MFIKINEKEHGPIIEEPFAVAYIAILVLVLSFFLFIGFNTVSKALPEEKNVLILHSYNIDYSWTQDQHNAFVETLSSFEISPKYSVEVLDTKKYSGTIDYEYFRDVVKLKHPNQNYDLIYATDNDAYNFLNLY